MRDDLASALGGYVIGAVPLAYLAGRVFGGVDLRETGTGTAGASNLSHTRSRWAVAPVGLAQVAQGALPPLLARRRGASAASQVMSGLASIAGQDWSIFLGFRGGRGVTHSIGFLLALSPAALAGLTACGLAGVALRQIPLAMIAGLALSPVLAARSGRPPSVVAGCAALAALALAKRIEANGRPSPGGQRRWLTFAYRALFDRDVLDRNAWLGGRPLASDTEAGVRD